MRTRLSTISVLVALGAASALLSLTGCAADSGDETLGEVSVAEQEMRRGGSRRHGDASPQRPGHHRPRHGHGHGHHHGDGDDDDGTPGAAGAAPDDGGASGGASTSAGGSGAGGSGVGGFGAGGNTSTGGTSTGGSSAGGSSSGGGTSAGGGTSMGGGMNTGGSPPSDAVCGDGVFDPWWESCEDGNDVDGDGCDENCWWEPGWACSWETGLCHPVVCGDGLVEEYENCDDGNTAAGDGCDVSCVLEPLFACDLPGEPCRAVECGDGVQDWYLIEGEDPMGTGGSPGAAGAPATGGSDTGGSDIGGTGTGGTGGGTGYYYAVEGCDDGNASPGDGCSSACEVEDGWLCDLPGSPCREPRCGDGFQDYIPGDGSGTGGAGGASGGSTGGAGTGGSASSGWYEQCDDGNEASGDGCTDACEIEAGYACYYPGEPCHLAVCGDGIADWPAEECDDGNDDSTDWCVDCVYNPEYWGTGGMGAGGASSVGGGPGTGGISSGGTTTGGADPG